MKNPHRHSLLTLVLAGVLIALCAAATPASAELRRYILEYDNVSNTKAQARGFIVIDDAPAAFSNPGANSFPASGAWVKDYQLTISKATNKTHNGTFNAADFSIITLQISPAVDLSKELIGQAGLNDFNLFNINPLAPRFSSALTIATGDGTGDEFVLSSFRPVVTSSARVYKGTLSVKGSYKYCDLDYLAPGVPQWVCKKYRNKASFYMTIDPQAGKLGFFWLDPKTKTFDFERNYALPELKYAQCRPPSGSAPAGKWEAFLPLWCHTEDINIDFQTNPELIDARRCRIACLSGAESLRTFTFNDYLDPTISVRLRDHAVASLKGGFSQSTSYGTVHYAFDDPKRGKVLHWPFANIAGETRLGGGSACISGTMSLRLDTKLTAVALSAEDALGSGFFAAHNAVQDDLFAKDWTLEFPVDKGGAPLTLQPAPSENISPLIP